MLKRNLWGVFSALLVIGLSGYVLLDTFVFRQAYGTAAEPVATVPFETALQDLSEAEDTGTELSGDTEASGVDNSAAEGSDVGETETAPEAASGRHHRGRRSPSGAEAGSTENRTAEHETSESETVKSKTSETSSASGGFTLGEAQGDGYAVTLTEYQVSGTHVYAADVRITSAERIRTAFAEDTYGKNITAKTSEIAAGVGAVLAVNGDYYGARERGYVIRNGTVYRDLAGEEEVLCLYGDGVMKMERASENMAEELAAAGVWQTWTFGPALVKDGEIVVTAEDEVGRAKASNPRTALGMAEPGHYLFVVSDGRTEESVGLSLRELASFMRELGAVTAYNLDGGGSSTMVFQGELVNQPTTSGNRIKERGVSDIVYVG